MTVSNLDNVKSVHLNADVPVVLREVLREEFTAFGVSEVLDAMEAQVAGLIHAGPAESRKFLENFRSADQGDRAAADDDDELENADASESAKL